MLLRQASSDYRCLLVPADHNPFSAMDYGVEAAEAAIVFDVCALAEIGNAKNNLIGVSGRDHIKPHWGQWVSGHTYLRC